MKNKQKKTKTLLIVLIILLLLGVYLLVAFLPKEDMSKKQACYFSGGIWRTFSNGCGDSCVKERESPDNPVMCTLAFKDNCDCGPFRCWNYEKQRCELN